MELIAFHSLEMSSIKPETLPQTHVYISSRIIKKNPTRMQTFAQWVSDPISTQD